MTDSSVSTRVASDLLTVHESSIKRWCNAGELDYWTTPGGHRRIPIAKLVEFSVERGIEADIVNFGDSAERVWIGMEAARRDGNFHVLSKLVLEWINLGRADMIEHLLPFLVGHGFSLADVFDEVLASAMGRIGSLYSSQKLTIGEEHRMTHDVRDALLGMRRSLARRLDGADVPARPTAVVGCLRGEVHEIGALMIRLLLTQGGWDVVYLGQDVPTEEFHSQALRHQAGLICISVAPPRGEAEAANAVNLLTHLFAVDHPIEVRVAIGGALLPDEPNIPASGSLAEVRFFRRTKPFQDWVTGL